MPIVTGSQALASYMLLAFTAIFGTQPVGPPSARLVFGWFSLTYTQENTRWIRPEHAYVSNFSHRDL
ncbi:hypothetical protein MTR67_010366, partial [Solanum verrucosum]